MELIDSSAWIEYLRGTGSRANVEVRQLVRGGLGSVVTTEPVVMELLAGATDDHRLARLERLTDGLRLLPVDAGLDYRQAALAFRAVRAGGYTVRRLLDCLIAAVALRNGATLVHRDRDFDLLGAALPELQVRSLL
ncbi:MAG: PIN domain nuclease [Actinomycetota bacterium]|nr:PIN domain nuclease [Actinomycetota bacterium]